MIKKIFSHSVIYGLAPLIPAIANIFMLPLISAHLTNFDYGIYGSIMAYRAGLQVFNYLGLTLAVVNVFYHHPNHYKMRWRHIYSFLYAWCWLFNLILAGILWFALPSDIPDTKRYLIITLLTLPNTLLGPAISLGINHLQIRQKPFGVSIRSIIFGVLHVSITYYTIAILQLGYMGWFISIFVNELLHGLSYLPYLIKQGIYPILAIRFRLLKKSFKLSLPEIPRAYAIELLNSSDRMIMDIQNVPTEKIGEYNVAYTFGNYTIILGNAFRTAINPIYYTLYKQNKEFLVKKINTLAMILFILGACGVCLWLPELFQYLFRKEELYKNYPYAIFIVMTACYQPLYGMANVPYLYYEKTSKLWHGNAVAAVFNVIANLITIPIFGIEAAAVTTFFSFMLMIVVLIHHPTFKSLTKETYHPIRWISLITLIAIGMRYACLLELKYRLIMSFILILLGAITLYFKRDLIAEINKAS